MSEHGCAESDRGPFDYITHSQGGRWTATVNHAGAAGKPVTLKTELTDANGNSVIQTVTDAYAVR